MQVCLCVNNVIGFVYEMLRSECYDIRDCRNVGILLFLYMYFWLCVIVFNSCVIFINLLIS